MANYSITDFQLGDSVYHLSNSKLIMVAVKINTESNEVSCRWIDKDGKTQSVAFMPEELGKTKDLQPRISIVSSLP